MIIKRYALWVLFFLIPWQIMGQNQEENSVIDLSTYDFAENPEVYLDGHWEFYWNRLIQPGSFSDFSANKTLVDYPHLWTSEGYPAFGAATYRVRVLLPDQYPELALIVPDAYSSYQLYINGFLFAENGIPALDKESYKPYWSHIHRSLSQLPDSVLTKELELVLQIANFDHSKGGTSQQMVLGTKEVIDAQKLKDQAYSWILTGGLLLAGLFFLGLFAFSSNDRSILYFSLFCLFYTYRVIGFGVYPLHDLIPNAPWIITLRLEYLTLFISVFFFGLYTYHLYPKEASKLLVNILSGICLVFAFTSLFFPPHIFSLTILPFFIILSVYIAYAFYVYVLGMMRKRPGSAFALASTGVVFLIFLYQIANYFGYVNRYQIFNYSGHLLFIFLQSQILNFRFTKSLKEARINAEAASKAKSEFLSTMSHEIRTPLNAVIGYSELLNDGTLNKEKKEYVKSIRLSGENLLGIINNILDYSKIESGKLHLDYSELKPKEVIETVFELLSKSAQEKQIKLVLDLHDEFPEIISTDKTRLQQIFINLINNAIKFTKKGTVTVSASLNKDSSFPGNICFTVKDTGIGIAERDIEKLFKRFSQVDSGTTREYGGTGLGLVISKEIVEAMGGRIAVKSHHGKGTVFTFTIQARLESIPEKKYEFPSKVPASNNLEHSEEDFTLNDFSHLKVLVVEDNIMNQKVTLKILEKFGIQADLAENGHKAVERSGSMNYDIIFMDMHMPVLDGIEAAKLIRITKDSPSNKSTIIALTANATTLDRELCFEAGMNDFLSKPITIEQTQGVLKKWSDKN